MAYESLNERAGYRLADWAVDANNNFHAEGLDDRGCTCFISPPCGHCTHEGNPANLNECDEAWEKLTPDEMRIKAAQIKRYRKQQKRLKAEVHGK